MDRSFFGMPIAHARLVAWKNALFYGSNWAGKDTVLKTEPERFQWPGRIAVHGGGHDIFNTYWISRRIHCLMKS